MCIDRLVPLVRAVGLVVVLVAPAAAKTLKVPSKPHPTIQSAIDAASPGDTVEVDGGTYFENLLVPPAKSGLTLAADGPVILDARTSSAGDGPGIEVRAPNVTIDGFVVRNAADAPGGAKGHGILVVADAPTVRDCVVQGCRRVGVQGAAPNARVLDTKLIGNGGGVDLEGDGVVLKGCLFRLVDGTAAVVAGGGAKVIDNRFEVVEQDGVLVNGPDAVVRKNRFVSIDGDSIGVKGDRARIVDNRSVSIYDTHAKLEGNDGLILDNVFTATDSGYGIEVDGDRNTIRKNRVSKGEYDLIEVDGDDNVIEENVITLGADTGIEADGDRLVVRDNDVRRMMDQGIRLSGNDFLVVGNRIREITEGDPGILVFVGPTVVAGAVLDNEIDRVTAAGIEVRGGSGLLIAGNRVRRCGGDGAAAFEIEGVAHLVRDNLARDNANDGFRVEGTNVELRDNRAIRNLKDGFEVVAGSVGVALRENEATENGAEGLANLGASTVATKNVLEENRIDLANSGTFAQLSGNAFQSGGAATAPIVD